VPVLNIEKKYNIIRKQLIKYANLSLTSISSVVTEFKEGDFYQRDIASAERILAISKANHKAVLKALER
jgi:hypothetical protein